MNQPKNQSLLGIRMSLYRHLNLFSIVWNTNYDYDHGTLSLSGKAHIIVKKLRQILDISRGGV